MPTISAKDRLNKGAENLFFVDKEIPPPDEVFKFYARLDGGKILLNWDIEKGCYLYLDKFSFLDKNLNTYIKSSFPEGEILEDEYFGKVKVFYDEVEVTLNIGKGFEKEIIATYQGCNQKGYCYSPIKKFIVIKDKQLKVNN